MNKLNQLPKDWKWAKVSSVAELYRGINYTKDVATNTPSKDNLPILRGNNINGELNYQDLVYVPKELIKAEQLIKKDDIIFAMSSGSKHLVGKSAVAKSDFKGSYGAFCAMLRVSNEVSKQYVAYIFKGNSYRKLISEIAKGTNINNLKREHILDFEFPLPPKPIQLAIVSKIEELFSELEKGIESLFTAKQQLKTYRQSVLKRAFEGIEKKQNKTVEECCLKIVDCLHSTAKFTNAGYYCVDTTCIENGRIVFEKIRYVNEKTYSERISRLKPEEGDILFAREGTVGTTLIVPHNIELCLGQRMMMFRLKKEISSKYFMYYFQSEAFKSQYRLLIMGTTAPHLNIGDTRRFNVILCPIEEQHKIVEAIESRLSVADKMEESITQSLQQAEALKQSILKKAFEGKLI